MAALALLNAGAVLKGLERHKRCSGFGVSRSSSLEILKCRIARYRRRRARLSRSIPNGIPFSASADVQDAALRRFDLGHSPVAIAAKRVQPPPWSRRVETPASGSQRPQVPARCRARPQRAAQYAVSLVACATPVERRASGLARRTCPLRGVGFALSNALWASRRVADACSQSQDRECIPIWDIPGRDFTLHE